MVERTDHADEHDESQDESEHEKLTRNWNELLQELRVTQTGSQILAGFLLTVPFSQRYTELSELQVRVHLAIICGALASTGLVVAPVAFHRLLFRQSERRWIVEAASQAARAGLVMLALTSSGVLFLIFDVAVGRTPALVALVVALLFFSLLWLVVPAVRRHDD